MDRTILLKMEQLFDQLKCKIIVCDSAGNSLLPDRELRYHLPEFPSSGVTVRDGGRIYYPCRNINDIVLMTFEEEKLTDDTFYLIDALFSAYNDMKSSGLGTVDLYRKIVLSELSKAEIELIMDETSIPMEQNRCVILFHMGQIHEKSALDTLDEYLARTEDDLLVGIDRHNAVLIKDVSAEEEIDELRQYAFAAQETLLSEAAQSVTIGIGEVAPTIAELHASYLQARRAIEIGRVFREGDQIYLYRAMLLERFLSTLSPDTAAHYHSMLFNASTAKLLNEEMLATINMFFKKDLNLSDTARQLYIHRNTLVYRLDKIQREIGLDLRKFEDAVTFKMLMDMNKCKNT